MIFTLVLSLIDIVNTCILSKQRTFLIFFYKNILAIVKNSNQLKKRASVQKIFYKSIKGKNIPYILNNSLKTAVFIILFK